ncbi:regulator of MON1-CCZ1 complex-like [Oscarella lobularis]|uniref:regulator of MON1-CCZ1 complex-like n=1 Tax=Oscarella lobularis TaxID=121494 RepID=UPI003313A0DF
MSTSSSHYITFSREPLRFEPVGKSNSVFFDESNKQVFSVGAGNSEVSVRSLNPEINPFKIRIPDSGPVASIKFSLDHRILAIQRSPQIVDFVNLEAKGDSVPYRQQCRGKHTQVNGFQWIGLNEIAFITSHGVELYSVFPDKRSLKLIKNYSVTVNWFVFSCLRNVLLLSSGASCNTIHPYWFKQGTINRTPKFDVDLPQSPTGQTKPKLLERDVTLASLYDSPYVVVVKSWSKMMGVAEIVLYLLTKDSPPRPTNVLKLDMTGRFAINVVDNLLLVHHQASKTSVMFDIRWDGEVVPGGSSTSAASHTVHLPVVSPLPIASCVIVESPQAKEIQCETYSPTWVVFQPNIVIDAKLGCLWEVTVKLEPLVTMMTDKARLIDFLLLRADCRMVILSVCKQALVPGRQCMLSTIARIFDKLNTAFREYMQTIQPLDHRRGSYSFRTPELKDCPSSVIGQSDMYTHVLSIFESSSLKLNYKFVVAVLIEYIRSLNQHQIQVMYILYELLIKTLVGNHCFYQLHQFIQYHVLSDSKQLACLLLSIENEYPPAYQIALDMLKRQSTADAQIIDILLSKGQVLQALRFSRSVGKEDSISARLFLEAAANTRDNMLLYTVFKFFEERNIRMRKNPHFAPGEHCDQYVQLFRSQFATKQQLL